MPNKPLATTVHCADKDPAEKIFGDMTAPLGKTLNFQHDLPSVVTGVIADIPANTHLTIQPCAPCADLSGEGWPNAHLYTYVLLRKKRSGEAGSPVPAFFERYLKAGIGTATKYRIQLQPLPPSIFTPICKTRSAVITATYAISCYSRPLPADLIIAVINYI